MDYMKYLFPKKIRDIHWPWQTILVICGFIWITFNVYFLPFYIWTAGIMRPWYILHGLVPFKDFVWLRTPFDLFLLAFWYKIFGTNPQSYQLFIFALFLTLALCVFFFPKMLDKKLSFYPFIFFVLFLFPLFQNTEEGEIIIGWLSLLLFVTTFLFLKSQKLLFLFLAGIITGLAIITKQNSSLILFAVIATLLFDWHENKRSFGKTLKHIVLYGVFSSVPVLLLIFYFFINDGLDDFFYYAVGFVLGQYRGAPINQGNGLQLVLAFAALLVPFIFLKKHLKIPNTIPVLLTSLFIALLPALLPSFLSYRAFPAFVMSAIVAGYLIYMFLNNSTGKTKTIIALSFVLFGVCIWTFLQSYVVGNTEVKNGQYLKDHGETQYKIASWIQKNTKEDDKIISYGSEIIYLLANRLPQNKYVDPFPYLLQPYDKTSQVFVQNPPSVFVFDETLPKDHKGLSDWPFLSYVKSHYKKEAQFGESFSVYKYHKL